MADALPERIIPNHGHDRDMMRKAMYLVVGELKISPPIVETHYGSSSPLVYSVICDIIHYPLHERY